MRVSELDDIERRVLMGQPSTATIKARTIAAARAKAHLLDSLISDRCPCGGMMYTDGHPVIQTSDEMAKVSVAVRCASCQRTDRKTSVVLVCLS